MDGARRGILRSMNWKKLFDSVGLNGTKWQWRIMRWQQGWSDRRESLRQQGGHVAYRHKFCSCGALMARDERTCPHCGKRAPSWRAQVVQRAVGLVVPSALAVSTTLVIINSMLFMLVVALEGTSALLLPSVNVLRDLGGFVPSQFLAGRFPTMITYGYLHLGLIHFAFNMLVLSQVGPMLEQEIGKARFLTLFTMSLIGGAMARLVFSGPAPILLVGASGGLFGFIGFGVSYAHTAGGRGGEELRAFFVRWAIYGFLFGVLVGADTVAHLGGFLVGLLGGYGVGNERDRDALNSLWNTGATLCALATIASFGWIIWERLG